MKFVKRLPALDTMMTFEAAARHLSFTRAAVELNLSQSAVSRQIQQLENRLGVHLFTRKHKTLELTHAGLILMRGVNNGLDNIRQAVSDIQSNDRPMVRIHCSLAMASYWLLPGLAEFQSKYPDINIRLISSDDNVDLKKEKIDFLIRYGAPISYNNDYQMLKLFNEQIFPVAHPDYIKDKNIDDLNALVCEKLIGVNFHNNTVVDWQTWLHLSGYKQDIPTTALTVSNFDLAIRAAQTGQGIALMWSYVARKDFFSDGHLTRVTQQVLSTQIGEYLVFHRDAKKSPANKIFFDWLLEYSRSTNYWIEELLGVASDSEQLDVQLAESA